jgi:hypothetical protein
MGGGGHEMIQTSIMYETHEKIVRIFDRKLEKIRGIVGSLNFGGRNTSSLIFKKESVQMLTVIVSG